MLHWTDRTSATNLVYKKTFKQIMFSVFPDLQIKEAIALALNQSSNVLDQLEK